MVDVDPESFLPDLRPPEKSLRDVCHERASGRPEKRKLVTLNEANEVAKRLAAQKSSEGLNLYYPFFLVVERGIWLRQLLV